jgi:HD-like signal output (HDOD) protein
MAKKILLVDDEIQILKVLKRLFAKTDYNVYFAEGGQQALDILKTETIDMIITDLRMPGIDGYDLLSEVKRVYPEVIRLVISGYADEMTIYRLFRNNLTKMCIYKPWDNTSLLNNIKQIFELNSILTSNHILQIIKNLEHLPAINNIYLELCELMDSNADIKMVEILLMKDQAIVASILRVANSAFFNINTGSLRKAISYIGLNQIKNIVLVANISHYKKTCRKLDAMYELFSNHSILTNNIFNLIYKDLLTKELSADNSCIGLLIGIGRIVLLNNFPTQYTQIIKEWSDGKEDIYQIEKKVLGVSYQEMSGYLLNWWGLPYRVVEPILYHRSPMGENIINKEITLVIYLADYYATKYYKMLYSEELDGRVFEYLNISREELEKLINSKLIMTMLNNKGKKYEK